MAELACDVVVVGEGESPFGDRDALLSSWIMRGGRQRRGGLLEGLSSTRRFEEARTAEDDDRRPDALLGLNQFRFEQLQPETQRTQLIALQKVGVSISRDIGG